jgi:hypothetical protein
MVPTPTSLRNGSVSLHRVYQYTSVWRPLDPRYPTNRAIVLIAFVAAIVRGVYLIATGIDWVQSASIAGLSGFAVLMSWVVGREIDPDHNASAFIAAGLALIALTQFRLPDVAAVFWIVVLMRIINRIVGKPATWIDLSALLALVIWLSLQVNALFSMLTAYALLLESMISQPVRRQQLLFNFIAAGLSIILMNTVKSYSTVTLFHNDLLNEEIAVLILFAIVMFSTRKVISTGDIGNEPLDPMRIRLAQSMAAIAALMTMGSIGFLLPVWAAMSGVLIHRAWMILSRITKKA